MSDLYSMKLHETLYYKAYSIIRVPGGWIYVVEGAPLFVAFNPEFM